MIYIFDLDGTIINSSDRHLILLNRLFDKYGLSDLSDKTSQYLNYKADGYSTKQYLSQVLNIDDERISIINSEWISHIEDSDLLEYDYLYADAKLILEELSKNSIIYFVTSRKNTQNTINELNKFDIIQYAEHIYITNPKNGFEGKSVIFQKIKGKNDEKTIVVGDTEIDYQAAKQNNLDSYLLNRGFRSKKFWDKLKIQTHSDLLGLLGDK